MNTMLDTARSAIVVREEFPSPAAPVNIAKNIPIQKLIIIYSESIQLILLVIHELGMNVKYFL